MFCSRIYLRDYVKFDTCTVIFMDNGLGGVYKGFGYRTVFGMYLVIFDDYRVGLLKQLTNTN